LWLSINEVRKKKETHSFLPSILVVPVTEESIIVFRMGISYNKRRNMVELAVMRHCTTVNSAPLPTDNNSGSESVMSGKEGGDGGWPGMMSIRAHELDGVYDHPVLLLAGEACQLVELQCHSKLSAKRNPKPKKGAKADGSDDNADLANQDAPLAGSVTYSLFVTVKFLICTYNVVNHSLLLF
jgi:hypothetical protein